jgi:hypothetical protein
VSASHNPTSKLLPPAQHHTHPHHHDPAHKRPPSHHQVRIRRFAASAACAPVLACLLLMPPTLVSPLAFSIMTGRTRQRRRKTPPRERRQLPAQSARTIATRSSGGAAAAGVSPALAALRAGPAAPAAPTAAEIDAWMAARVPVFNAARAAKGLGVLSNASLAHLRGLAPSKILASRRGDLEGSFAGSALQAPWDAQFMDATRHGNPPPGEVPLPTTGVAAAAPVVAAVAPVAGAAAVVAAPTSSALVSSTAAATSSGTGAVVSSGIDPANILATGGRSRAPAGGVDAYRAARARRIYASGGAPGAKRFASKQARRTAPALHPSFRGSAYKHPPEQTDVEMTVSSKKRGSTSSLGSSTSKMASITQSTTESRGGVLCCSLYHLPRPEASTATDSEAEGGIFSLTAVQASSSSTSTTSAPVPAGEPCYLTHQLHAGLAEWWCDRCEVAYGADDPTYCCSEHDYDLCPSCADEMRSDEEDELLPLVLESEYHPPLDDNGFPTITEAEWKRLKALYTDVHKSVHEWNIEPTYWVRIFYVVSDSHAPKSRAFILTPAHFFQLLVSSALEQGLGGALYAREVLDGEERSSGRHRLPRR